MHLPLYGTLPLTPPQKIPERYQSVPLAGERLRLTRQLNGEYPPMKGFILVKPIYLDHLATHFIIVREFAVLLCKMEQKNWVFFNAGLDLPATCHFGEINQRLHEGRMKYDYFRS